MHIYLGTCMYSAAKSENRLLLVNITGMKNRLLEIFSPCHSSLYSPWQASDGGTRWPYSHSMAVRHLTIKQQILVEGETR